MRDNWVLEIADFNSSNWKAIANGNQTISGNLVQLDTAQYTNGFYQLRLTARDISESDTTTTAVIEVNSANKSSRSENTVTDLSVNIGGTALNLVRTGSSVHSVPNC